MQKKHGHSKKNKNARLKTVQKRATGRRVSKVKVHPSKSHVVLRKPIALNKKTVHPDSAPAEVVVDAERVKETDTIISGGIFSEFVVKNVGRQGVALVKILNSAPHTDDKLAVRMDMKVNEVRRMLNVLNGYGITKYDINKDGKGWLTFKWYLDREKLNTFYNALQEKQNGQKVSLQENCNDFFYCTSCYKSQKLILPFDSAYELGFKCESCGRIFGVLNKEQASALFVSSNTV